MNKEIENINNKGLYHGYQEIYNWNNKLWYRAIFKNGNPIGYLEYHITHYKQTEFYIK